MHLFPFFFNKAEAPACPIALITYSLWSVKRPRHTSAPGPQWDTQRHNRMVIMVREKLGARGLKHPCPISTKTPLLPHLSLWGFSGPGHIWLTESCPPHWLDTASWSLRASSLRGSLPVTRNELVRPEFSMLLLLPERLLCSLQPHTTTSLSYSSAE